VIVGFPGESGADFLESLEFVKLAEFAKVHVFPYSIRKGTIAAEISNQVEKKEKKRRSWLMAQVGDAGRNAFLKAQIGLCAPVLFEKRVGQNRYQGLTPNYQIVQARSDNNLAGLIKNVHIGGVEGQMLCGDLIDTTCPEC
jgi:threonylcarbamoyladenosine tRNA methylthiotransferase MtaB